VVEPGLSRHRDSKRRGSIGAYMQRRAAARFGSGAVGE
jgi:hypothetical protein